MVGGRVRRARQDDAVSMGRVHVRAWKAAYRGHMPDEYLDSLVEEEAALRWADALNHRSPVALVLEDEHGDVVGISSVGPARRRQDAALGEVWMINLEPEAWGRGLGRQLLEAATAHLRTQGYREAELWVLDGNERARRFYERAGWHSDGSEWVDDSRGFPVREVRYRRQL